MANGGMALDKHRPRIAAPVVSVFDDTPQRIEFLDRVGSLAHFHISSKRHTGSPTTAMDRMRETVRARVMAANPPVLG